MARLVRFKVRLPEEVNAALRALAVEEGVSVSELVRRGVDSLLRTDRSRDHHRPEECREHPLSQ